MDVKPLLFLVWCMIIIAFQVSLFMNGFLLTRVSQLQNSTCSQVPGQTCVEQKNKVVLVVIDAFRYDFAVFNVSNVSPLYFENKLKIIDDKLKYEPENSRLYKFIADPPTTTMQRLKALTTGSLPTFIDAGSNFATHEINEDNLIDQIVKRNHNAIFMGDDTWTGLYPKRFLRSYPYPSFNVWDLDTVDNGVLSHLYDELAQNDWKLLIAHFLGVDHCGHRYGPNHPEMKRKLLQMNDVIGNVSKLLPQDSVMFVIGDHGMTSTGDHGGESESELNAAMFVYSKLPLANANYDSRTNIAKQVDIVPTIATLLGIPIPFSNLGSLIHDCIPAYRHRLDSAVIAAWSNARQLMTYINAYSSSSNLFTSEKLHAITQTFNGLEERFTNIMIPETKESLNEFITDVHNFVITTRKSCEEIWIQFDAYSMARGLLIIATLTVFLYLLVTGLEKLEILLTAEVLLACYLSLALSAFFAYVLYIFNVCMTWTNTTYFVSGLFALVITATLTIRNFEEISSQLYAMSKNRDWTDLVTRVMLVFAGLMLLSNSFILEESKVMLFFMLSLIIIQLAVYVSIRLRHTNKSIVKILRSRIFIVSLIVCALLRLSTNFWRCREEQGCNNSIFLPAKTLAGKSEWLIAVVASTTLVVLARMWLRACGNLNGLSLAVLLAKFGSTTAIVSISGFWILQSLTNEARQKLLGAHNPMQPHILAWVAYALIALGISSICVHPLCIYHVNDKSKKLEVQCDNPIPQLARYVCTSTTKETPVVFGLATVYSAPFVIILTNALLLWLLLLNFAVVPSCIALITIIALSLLVNTILKFEQADSVEALIAVPSSSVMIWVVMSVYMFYATGHQAAFPNIAWEAAFVGTLRFDGQLVNNFIPAALVIINTFGSYIIMGLSLPLLVISPFSIAAMAPSFINNIGKFVLHRGELELLDHEDRVQRVLYKLSFDYIMCHIFRMFCMMLSATIHCRHLMVWNVFAPKLIFEAIGLFVSMTSVCFSLLLFTRINSSLDKFLANLPKKMS